MIGAYQKKFSVWFKTTFVWWITTLFGRLGILFALASFVLVLLTYYVINWAVDDKDNILDVHDAYYHYQFVQSWGDDPDTNYVKKELDNLKLLGAIFYIDADTLCSENYVFDKKKERSLTYWHNIPSEFSLCDYISYQDSEYLSSIHNVNFPELVSFGDFYFKDEIYPASVVENSPWQILLVVNNYAYPKEWVTFMPIIILSVFFMLLLYLVVWKFLQPINIIKNRIIDLEAGDLESQIKIKGNDELARLSHNFNNLIEQVKNLLKQKERLLSEVSHELKTPLAKIRLLIAMVPVNEKIKKIDKHIDYLDSIITNILISDKLAMPYTNLEIESISVNSLVKQASDISKNKNIKIIQSKSFIIKCDVVKMSIVIKNLLDNAEKYAESNKPVEISSRIDGTNVAIAIRDFGPGIDSDLIEKITEPYIRGKNLKQPGFGLGLSICKKVMASHHGSLKIKNIEGGGCMFSIVWDFNIL